MRNRCLIPLLIAALGLTFFAPLVLHPRDVLYSDSSDLLAEHLPAKRFLVRSLRETGEVPLWCPYSFSGTSVIHDIQAQVMYPPHWLLFLLPEEYVGAGLSWIVVAHVLLAGWGMYAYARSQDLSALGALMAAIGYMFAGKWMLHLLGAGHYVTIGMAWLPLVLLFLEGAIRHRSAWRATAAGVVYGLMALGTQPQWTFYAGLFAGLWTVGAALESYGRTGKALLIWLLCGAWTVGLAVALAAVQLLPTLEAARWSTRAGGVVGSDALRGGIQSLLFLIGPSLRVDPRNLQWEDRGGFGLLWLSAAVAGAMLGWNRTRFQAGVAAVVFLFAFGGSMLVESFPGFNLFRQPSRMLLIATFPVALFAGRAVQAFTGADGAGAKACNVGMHVFARTSVAGLILVGGFALRSCIERTPVAFHVYWLTLAASLPAAFWLLRKETVRWSAAGWVGVLLADAWGLAWPLVEVKPQDVIYPASRCVQYLAEHRDVTNPGRVLDCDVSDHPARGPLGRGEPLALVYGLESVRGYNPLDNRLYRKYLQFMEGRDEPLRSMEDPLTFPILSNVEVKNKALLDLLGVRFLVQPSSEPSPGPDWEAVEHDPDPVAYNFDSGFQPLDPYTVYRNMGALERVFVVPQARLLTNDKAYEELSSTDFHSEVLLSDGPPEVSERPAAGFARRAAIREYHPNWVEVEVEDGDAGFLVLTDPWYPGWMCKVDGTPAPLYRGDYLFRAVHVTPGVHRVEFTFLPNSYWYGRVISVTALAAVAMIFLFALARGRLQKSLSVSCSRSELGAKELQLARPS